MQRADDEQIYISAGLLLGDNIAVSSVPNAYDGMKVRLPGDLIETAPEVKAQAINQTDEEGE